MTSPDTGAGDFYDPTVDGPDDADFAPGVPGASGPVHEGDTLYSELTVEGAEPLPGGRGGLVRLRSDVYAAEGEDRQVLDWRFTGLLF